MQSYYRCIWISILLLALCFPSLWGCVVFFLQSLWRVCPGLCDNIMTRDNREKQKIGLSLPSSNERLQFWRRKSVILETTLCVCVAKGTGRGLGRLRNSSLPATCRNPALLTTTIKLTIFRSETAWCVLMGSKRGVWLLFGCVSPGSC